MSKTYRVNEIFYSLQGEGVRAGTANIFLRFSGCNLTCNLAENGFNCDTEFVSGRTLTRDAILQEMASLLPPNSTAHEAVILTGGEPALQIDAYLIAGLKDAGYFVAVETNGTHPLPEAMDWITVSPKTAEHTIRIQRANEVKYVRSFGQALPRPQVKADYYLISPACTAEGAFTTRDLQWCTDLVKENPTWRLSLQTHKLLRIR